MRSRGKFPPGCDEERVRRVLGHYEEQSDAEPMAEDEAAFESTKITTMEVPVGGTRHATERPAAHKA